MSSQTSVDSFVPVDCIVQPAPGQSATTGAGRQTGGKTPRLACLDALRSWMMLLGIVLHAANAYAIGCPDWWPVRDRFRCGIFDALVFATHLFRMEIFFLLSGFFGRLLLRRYGLAGFISNRGRRVLLPLAIGLVMMAIAEAGAPWCYAPPQGAPTTFPNDVSTPWPSEVAISAVALWHPWFCHLWFLEYLALFYVGIVVLDVLHPKSWKAWLEVVQRGLTRLMRQAWMPAAAAGLTMLALVPMRSWVVDTPLSLVPQWRFFAYYGMFVGLGWMMHRNPALLTSTALHLNWRSGVLLLASVGVLLALLWNVGNVPVNSPWGWTLAIRGASAFCTWLALLQILGAVVISMNQPNPTLRYLADASYWCYLVHLPIILWLQGRLPTAIWGPVRFALVLAIAAAASLASYHLFVRYTPLNEVFGSRRSVKTAAAA